MIQHFIHQKLLDFQIIYSQFEANQQMEGKVMKKPVLMNEKKEKIEVLFEQKLKKIQIFYRYRIGSIYRQLKIPIYEKLLEEKKQKLGKQVKQAKMEQKKQPKKIQMLIDNLYKFVSLNSKYHHREKMRFSRTPLLKYIEYDFALLAQKSKTKAFLKMYDDLEDDEDDDDPAEKKDYSKDEHFNEQSITNYKKKNQINGRICIALGYEDLKQRLVEKHGWTENQDHSSLIFDFKFMSKKKDIDTVNLLDSQVINHFNENKSITAKFGLTRNIRNIVILGKDHNIFFPRCYDVNDVTELQDFYQDFKYTKLKSILIKFVEEEGKFLKGQEDIIKLVLKILSKELLPIDKKIELITNNKGLYISLEDWKMVESWNFFEKNEVQKDEALLKECVYVYKCLMENDPQFLLNQDNIWIVKPASMSRGRGIKTFNHLNQILDYVIAKEISWVAQKYIQRPLIIRKKKFDIRQWVLWTDFKPMRVWIYQQCYIRFCSEIYTPENLKNRKVHLTNNSVTKGVNQEKDGIQENMMSQETFSKELFEKEQKQIFKSIIKPQMRKIALESLESVKENVQFRKNTFELFGYDFMIDENYKVWLIEVNSSPTMEYSTKITTRLVQKGMSDLADLVENYMFKGKYYQADKAKQLYGGWKLLNSA